MNQRYPSSEYIGPCAPIAVTFFFDEELRIKNHEATGTDDMLLKRKAVGFGAQNVRHRKISARVVYF